MKIYDEDGNLVKEDYEDTDDTEKNEEENDEKEVKTVSLNKHMKLKNKTKKLQEELEKQSNLSDEDRKLLKSIKKERESREINELFEKDIAENLSGYSNVEKNKKLLKLLVNDIENKDKSIEDIYIENFAGDKKTVENTASVKKGEDSKYDFSNLTQEQEQDIMSDPTKSKAYNDYLDTL